MVNRRRTRPAAPHAVLVLLAVLSSGGCLTSPGSSGGGPAPSASASTRAPAVDPKAAAGALVDAWVRAQNEGRFDDYIALYDSSAFRGIRRSATGGEQRVPFDGWKKDRARLFALKPTVAVDALNVTPWTEDPTLTPGIVRVGFVQRWKSARYADHGPKVLRVRIIEGAARIIYEDMLSSAEGWDDAPAKVTIVDGTALVPPIKVKVVGASEQDGGDQRLGTLTLVLVDQKKTTREIEIGSYNGVDAQSYPPEPSGSPLFKVRLWWAGAGDNFHVVRDGVGLVVRHQWEQETGEDTTAPSASGLTDQIRVTLSPGAAVKAAR